MQPRFAAFLGLALILAGCDLLIGLQAARNPDLAWAPMPVRPDPSLVAPARERCLTEPFEGLGYEQLPLVVQDQRGADAAGFTFADATTSVTCFVYRLPDGTVEVSQVGASGIFGPPDALAHDFQGNGPGLTVVHCRAGAAATRVEYTLVDGRTVEATFAGGHCMAWWPGFIDPTTIRALDDQGAVIVELPAAGMTGG